MKPYIFYRWGYHDVNDTKEQVIKMREADIPLEGKLHRCLDDRFTYLYLYSDVERYRSVSCRPRLYYGSCYIPR